MSEQQLIRFVDKFPQSRVAVVGDLILDRYLWGNASRISQEAPVPVVTVSRETEVPGGAANVVNNLLSLGGQAAAFGRIGNDDHGAALCRILAAKGADTTGVLTLEDYPTTVKTRVIANHQQVVRIDYEETTPPTTENLAQLASHLRTEIESGHCAALIFEDYAKGLLTADFIQSLVDLAQSRGIPTALDPHPCHAFNVKGLTLMTPNRAEAFGLAGIYYQPTVLPLSSDQPLIKAGQRLRELWQVKYLLITLGPDGMAMFAGDDEPLHIPTRAREVYDVSGAGDTVTATFVLSLLAGATPGEAAEIANHAAGIVVAKVGTLPVEIEELRRSLATAG